MKSKFNKFCFLLIIILAYQQINTSVFAQAPQKMSYQAVIRNSSDQLITNHAVGMKISILQGTATGTVVYTETQTPTTNANGLVSIEIGGGTGFSAINWASGPYFIKTETDPAGGTSYTITSISQLLSVPYALHAIAADNGFSGNYNDLNNKPNIVDSIATHAFSGNYLDLTGKPELWDSTWISIKGKPNLASVATTGNYNDMINQPTIPTQTSQLTNNSGFISNEVQVLGISHDTIFLTGGSFVKLPTGFSGAYSDLTGKPLLWDSTYASIKNKPNLATVATSGSYNDLSNRPTLFNGAYSDLIGKPVLWDSTYASIKNKPNLATIATSGNYNDLTNKPNLVDSIHSYGFNGDYNSLTNKPIILDSTWANTTGDFTGNMNNNKIFNLANPTNSQDATTKSYVDTLVSSNSKHYVGEFFGGGIVYYVFDKGQHGLIASLTDLPTALWGDSTIYVDSATSYYDGFSNTLAIYNSAPGVWSGQGVYYQGASFSCVNYNAGGFNDWYLPSITELNLLYDAAYMLCMKLRNDSVINTLNPSGFNRYLDTQYWSSTQPWAKINIALMKSFMNGAIFNYNKENISAVRAIRRF